VSSSADLQLEALVATLTDALSNREGSDRQSGAVDGS
jgi:hypothetical protein